jgi:hypothetical protein
MIPLEKNLSFTKRKALFTAQGLFLDPHNSENHNILANERDRIYRNRAILAGMIGISWIILGIVLFAAERHNWVWKFAIGAGAVIIIIFSVKFIVHRGKPFDPSVNLPGLNQQLANQPELIRIS